MTTFVTHRNHQAAKARRLTRAAREQMSPQRRAERQVERLVFGLVIGLAAMACWTAADTLPSVVTASAMPAAFIA